MYQVNPIMGQSGAELNWFTKLGGIPSWLLVRTNRCHCSTVTSLAAMANRRGMTRRRGVSIAALRFGSAGGDPKRNSTGPSMTANVCPWRLTNQRR